MNKSTSLCKLKKWRNFMLVSKARWSKSIWPAKRKNTLRFAARKTASIKTHAVFPSTMATMTRMIWRVLRKDVSLIAITKRSGTWLTPTQYIHCWTQVKRSNKRSSDSIVKMDKRMMSIKWLVLKAKTEKHPPQQDYKWNKEQLYFRKRKNTNKKWMKWCSINWTKNDGKNGCENGIIKFFK